MDQPRNWEPLPSLRHLILSPILWPKSLEKFLHVPGFADGGGLEEVCAQPRLCQQEGMLRDLQKSVEEEEQVWKAKLSASESELQKVRVWGTAGPLHSAEAPGAVPRGCG